MTGEKQFNEYESVNSCPICRADHEVAFPPDVRKCKSCAVYFRSPRPQQSEIKRSYDSGSTYIEWEKDETPRRKSWKRRMAHIQKWSKPGSLLDIGTGDGHFLSLAQEAGFEVSGTELSSEGVRRSEQRGFTVRQGQFLELDFRDQLFDVITMWHVLEHLPEPGQTLDKVRKLIAPDGRFIVAVPNEENSLFRHKIGVKRSSNPLGNLAWGQEIHLIHFQPKTLRNALENVGFKVEFFGVDDIYSNRSVRNLLVLGLQKTLCKLTKWHFSMAMFAVCAPVLSSSISFSQSKK